MLVEINLLPQKEPRKFNIFILIVLLALTLIVGAFYFWQIQTTKSELANLDRQISMTKEIAVKEENNAEKNESQMSITLLKGAVEWANSYPIKTIPIMQHLTSLLPERGFIQSFDYAEAGTVILTVQFDSAREAAYFLDNLGESEWVGEPTLNSLTIEEKEEAEETVAQPTNEASAAEAGAQNHKPEPTPKIENNESNDQYLPRYIGQFEIKLNIVKIKELKTKSKEEGVTAS
ncbi:PilN domain-containing protein [Neobacillus niacini]|uniref:PilN domain-containing protein n=1 Tax=Neobacillus niacini TaxID=86668 RepID=UPI002FFD8F0D